MNDLKRPNPDELLARLREDERQQGRGKLKIFLGYVAGVGKTFAMLEAAHQRQEEGIDVAVAYVETHGRKETEALVAGLEVIPRRSVDYRGASLSEMDLDAVLARHPQLALVDELAHTNAPGSRHPKRYLDVEEILAAGIDVYTTVNIQHLESLNDVVQQITGVVVRETLPDRLVDEANEIELVDLPTGELLQRLKDGKVYVSEQAARALEKFFREGNLTALRELSMRRAAERVDSQMLNYMQDRAIQGPWPAGERILVSISSHPMGERLIRTGRRLADDLKAEWFVLFVETPGHLRMPEASRQRLQHNLQLAEQLGATVMSVAGTSAAQVLIDFAREHNITKIVAGKPLRPRWYAALRGSVIDQIIRQSGKIDVYVVSEEEAVPQRAIMRSWTPHHPLPRYIYSCLLVTLATLAGFPLQGTLHPTNLVMIYLAAVVFAAVFLGRGPSILASFLSVIAFDFFFVDPRFTFGVTDTQYILTFGGLFTVGLIISGSSSLLRDQVLALQRRDQQAQAVNRFSRELTAAVDLEQVCETVIRNLGDSFGREVLILLPQEEGRLAVRATTPGFQLQEDELAVAEWAFKNNQAAGHGTETLPAAAIRCVPLKTARGTVGVLGLKSQGDQGFLTLEQRGLLEAFANLSALAIERASFAEQAAHTRALENKEQLQAALLNSISHELRTPLASITGVLTGLGESEKAPQGGARLDPATRLELIDAATEQARQLNHLVENLLDMSRLEAGALRLNLETADLQDLVGSVLRSMAERLKSRRLTIHIPLDFPPLAMDVRLVAQVLSNLLDNAVKYSPPGSPVAIEVRQEKGAAVVSVCDAGFGIPPADLERVFDKFYRVEGQPPRVGTGLGLSISKGFVEAHGGQIWVHNNPGPGVTVEFSLPLGLEPGKEGA